MTAAKNVMGKGRKGYPYEDAHPYMTLRDERTGWLHHVLKTYQVDGRKPYGRAFCLVEGFATELGDVYVDDLRASTIISWDTAVFGTDGNAAAAALFGEGATL